MKIPHIVASGSNKPFELKYNQLVDMINNMEIKAPAAWGGVQPVVSIQPNKIVLDFSATVASEANTGADPYYDDVQGRGGSSGGTAEFPSGGSEYMVLQKDATGSEVWDYVRMVEVDYE